MPALRGSLTYVRFFVEGTLPDDFRERFMRSVRLRAMKPLEADDEDPERSGWCHIGDGFQLDLAYEDVFWNEHLNLGMRTDRWAIPTSMLRSRMREAEAAYLAKHGRERLTRKEKAEMKELVARRLRRQMSPATRVVDVSWALGEGVVRFFSHAPKPAGVFQDLFHKTFGGQGLALVPESPYTLAARLGLSRPEEVAWDTLETTSLADVGSPS